MPSVCSRLAFVMFFMSIARFSLASRKTDAAIKVMEIVSNPFMYIKEIMPAPDKSGPLEVESTIYVRNIKVDDLNMKMIVDLTFRMHWDDRRLQYGTAGVPSVRFSDVSKFWIPDAFFKDSSMTEKMESIHPESYIQVSNKGRVLYSTRMRLNLECPMDLMRFPHDTQTCYIQFASYGHTTKDIVFSFAQKDFLQVGESVMASNRFSARNFTEGHCDSKTSTGIYSCLEIGIEIKRDFVNYFIEWYMPCICIVIVAFFSELLSPESLVPRLILTIGPLMVLSSSSLNYKQTIPSVSYTTAVDVFTGWSIATIFAILLHVIIMYYYHTKPAQKIAPDTTSPTGFKKLLFKARVHANEITKGLLIAFYVIFICLYMLAYGTN